ncbi:GIY-YIG nuclease family protein [Candidatus Gottesmanbacteria bacterium]|nr:GIY-YIG nuclease family protein [Candidatus Gottesmanbacteria bacterium]
MDRDSQTIQKKTKSLNTKSGFVLRHISTRPGVYLYRDKDENVIYVGKAKNLRNRVRQYFLRDNALGQKTNLIVSQIVSIKTIPTDSEYDALLLEAALIRKYQPKYNAIAKDDKSPLYIAITFDESLPHILFTRKRALEEHLQGHPLQMLSKRAIFGPFQSGRVARRLMQSVRRIIPYCTQKKRNGAPCFYTHIGLCRPCPSQIVAMAQDTEKKKVIRIYRSNLRRIALLLSGQARRVRMLLEQSMHSSAKNMAFEEAADFKRQLEALEMLTTHAFDPSMYSDHTSEPSEIYQSRLEELAHIVNNYGLRLATLQRIECIDISTIQGKWASGSLVVFTSGIPDTDQYRRFRIKMSGKPNDVGMIAEVVMRRFAHPEWPFPDLLVVDGGRGQVHAAKQAIQATRVGREISVIGLAKRYEEIIVPNDTKYRIIRLAPVSPALQLVQHIRDEAHRFAKRYHMDLRSSYGFVTMSKP